MQKMQLPFSSTSLRSSFRQFLGQIFHTSPIHTRLHCAWRLLYRAGYRNLESAKTMNMFRSYTYLNIYFPWFSFSITSMGGGGGYLRIQKPNGKNACALHPLGEKTPQQIYLVLSERRGLSKSISAKLTDKKTAVPLPNHWEEVWNIPFPVTRKHPWTQWCQVSIWDSKSDSFMWVLVSFQGGFHSPLS